MVRFGLKSTLVAKYLGIQYVGQNLQREVCIAVIIILQLCTCKPNIGGAPLWVKLGDWELGDYATELCCFNSKLESVYKHNYIPVSEVVNSDFGPLQKITDFDYFAFQCCKVAIKDLLS